MRRRIASAGTSGARRARAVQLAVGLLVLGALPAALVLAARDLGPRPVRSDPIDPPAAAVSPPVVLGDAARTNAPVSEARDVGRRFLESYVAFLYGRVDAAEIRGVTAQVRRALRRSRLRVAPARAQRRPTIARVDAVTRTTDVVQVMATVDDGDIAPYLVTAFVERRGGHWLVTVVAKD